MQLLLILLIFVNGALSRGCSPNIYWANCPPGSNCDVCLRVDFSNADSDVMCLRSQSQSSCIYTGKLLGDGSYAVMTGSNYVCRPFSSDPLEVSMTSSKCSGGFIIENGQTRRPPPAFGPGVSDIVVNVPSSA